MKVKESQEEIKKEKRKEVKGEFSSPAKTPISKKQLH